MSHGARKHRTPALLSLLALGNFTVGMGAFVIIGIITPIAEGLSVTKAEAGIILTSYAIAYAVLSPVGAALTGSLPRRVVLTSALGLFCLGSVLSALSWSLPMLTASRVLVAFGAALFTPLSAGVAVAVSPPEQRGRALAKVFGGITLAQVVGVPLGAWLAYRFGWHSTFWTVAGLAAVSTIILLTAIPRDVSVQAAPLSAVLGALRDVRLMFATTFTATIITAIYIVFTFFGPLIEASAGSNPETRTFYLVLFGVGAVCGNYIGGYCSDRIGPKNTLLIICIAQILLMPLFSVMPWNPVLFAILVAVWSSFGWSFMAPQQSRLVAIAPNAQSLALALNAAMIYVGIAFGSAIGAGLLERQTLAALGLAGGVGAAVALMHLLASSRTGKNP
jgi:DHA1 family inner membrane transport protein